MYLEQESMDEIIKKIQNNLRQKNYLSALTLSLPLSDICCEIAYLHMKNRKGYPDIGGRYAKWYNKNIYAYKNPPNEIQMNPLDGEAFYKLRYMPDDAYIFPSAKSSHSTVNAVYKMFQKSVDLLDHQEIGTHTLRKTFGYHCYQKTHDIATLMGIFDHSSEKITKRYIQHE